MDFFDVTTLVQIKHSHEKNFASLHFFGEEISGQEMHYVAYANGISPPAWTHFTLSWQTGSYLLAFAILYKLSGNVEKAKKHYLKFQDTFIPNTQQKDITISLPVAEMSNWIRIHCDH